MEEKAIFKPKIREDEQKINERTIWFFKDKLNENLKKVELTVTN